MSTAIVDGKATCPVCGVTHTFDQDVDIDAGGKVTVDWFVDPGCEHYVQGSVDADFKHYQRTGETLFVVDFEAVDDETM